MRCAEIAASMASCSIGSVRVKDADRAIADIDQKGARTTIARAIVRQLAHQLSVRVHAELN
jgi:hypothetical protein